MPHLMIWKLNLSLKHTEIFWDLSPPPVLEKIYSDYGICAVQIFFKNVPCYYML